MPADWTIVQGDTAPLFSDTLTYSNGEAVNLETAVVKFVMRSATSSEPVRLTGETSIIGVKTGKVAFRCSAQDTAVVGHYMANWVVTFAGGEQMTFPTVGYMWVTVQESLTSQSVPSLVSLPEA